MKPSKIIIGIIAALAVMPATNVLADATYNVRPGESWASIAAAQCRQGTQPAALAQYNGMSVATPPQAGAAIRIPDSLSNSRSAVLQSFQGSVTINNAAAGRNQALRPNDTIATGANSSADVVLDNGSVMRLGANTRIAISQLALQGRNSNTGAALQNGSVTMQVTRMNRGSTFSVSTVSAVAGVRGTYFYISYDEATRNVGVACYTGNVQVGRATTDANGNTVVDPNGAVEVRAGHATTINGQSGAVENPFPIPGRIEWVEGSN